MCSGRGELRGPVRGVCGPEGEGQAGCFGASTTPSPCGVPSALVSPLVWAHGRIETRFTGSCPSLLPRGMHGLVMDSDLDASSQYPSPDGLATPETQLIAETNEVA